MRLRTDVDWQFIPVQNKECLACHDRSDDTHASHLFLEQKYSEIREDLAPHACISCHHEHRGLRVTREAEFCHHCHSDIDLLDDPLQPPASPSHSDLVEQEEWNSCLGCHDYHGSHEFTSPTEWNQRFSVSEIEAYLNGLQAIYSKPTPLSGE